ncbi:4Fe-4S binding protein, partial [Trebonia sp.]|uniref:4Fe-4S binding protein n=1 Tax=Trebonia sp. TaxID=2767075 RepID=UPI0026034A9C
MTHVITGTCCNDSACAFSCPVNCIHPAPGEPGYGSAELLFIDPDACIDCGACVDACPVHAVVPDYDLEERDQPFADLARAWFAVEENSGYPQEQKRLPAFTVAEPSALRVAVIGTGPAACYAIDALTSVRGLQVEVTVVERLLAPGGLVRYGVAPDHPETKAIGDQFLRTLARSSVSLHLGVEVGRDVTFEQLASTHHAVIVGSGAAAGRRLGIPGDDLAGVISAADFVGWYNGHPDYANLAVDLSGERAVVVGNGNVAIDVARVLLSGVDRLRRTDIAQHALEAFAASNVREVVLVGRRGIEHAAFTASELEGLARVPGLRISAVTAELEPTLGELSPERRTIVEHKASRLRKLAG